MNKLLYFFTMLAMLPIEGLSSLRTFTISSLSTNDVTAFLGMLTV